ncbi:MAG: DNA polymerase domain-containing protein [Acidilobus sp.]
MIVVDAIPRDGGVELVFDGFRRAFVRTTFPVYLEELPPGLTSHPSVVDVVPEEWRTLDGRPITIYRVEVRDLWAYRDLRRFRVVNDFISPLSQALVRINALPMHNDELRDGRVELNDDGYSFPQVTYAKVVLYDWYGEHSHGRYYRLYLNRSLREEGDVRDLEVSADVVECPSAVCDRVRASVKVVSELRRSPVDVKGLIMWSKAMRVLLREIRYASIGKALTVNEAWIAMRRYVVPRVVPRVEDLKTLEGMVYMDRPGLLVYPEGKCYDGVYQVDFSSMYPSIIAKYNISGETVNACNDVRVGPYTVCERERGVVAEAVERLIALKELYKGVDEELAEAFKWVLVASFGYLGYRNSIFGRIEAYELVTFLARATLRLAMELASEMGLEVVHGIVDSLMVRGPKEVVEEFVERVNEATGLRLKLEDEFSWAAFTRSSEGLPYPHRYVGRRPDGTLKVKGLLRANQPVLVREFYRDVLRLMSRAGSCSELTGLRQAIDELYRAYRARAIRGEPRGYVLWVRGEPYVRGPRGLYSAELGYRGHDPDYYLQYLARTKGTLKAMLP